MTNGAYLKYKVKWKTLTMKLSKFMFLTILSVVAISLLFRAFKLNFDMAAVFEHVDIVSTPLYIVSLYLFCFIFSALIGLCLSTAYITVTDTTISGRNYWMFKKHVPLTSIKRLYPFSDNGINAMVVDGGNDGSVYISTHTENYDELVDQMSKWAERNSK